VAQLSELAHYGVATVHESYPHPSVIELPLIQIVPRSRVAGRARPVMCGQNDNLMVHAALTLMEPGDVLVLTMPEPGPVTLIGELIATQAVRIGVAAILVDAAVRDVDELTDIGLPIWARWVRATGPTKVRPGTIDQPIRVGGVTVKFGDAVVLDADGAVVVPENDVDEVLANSKARATREFEARAQYQSGVLSYDRLGLRGKIDGAP
jgi:4-hydroxy-4-methyl-2-oxoglutarate aldolase